jgi:hypothetical protein
MLIKKYAAHDLAGSVTTDTDHTDTAIFRRSAIAAAVS